jgi:hypothetical protein
MTIMTKNNFTYFVEYSTPNQFIVEASSLAEAKKKAYQKLIDVDEKIILTVKQVTA